MVLKQFTRTFHVTRLMYAAPEKSVLGMLRKKTGYTFANCKKALEMHNNNLEDAEKWLIKQAQALGWSKATKLAERATAQGLVGVLVRGNIGAMVEVNCETDFVARNEYFRRFVDQVSRICAKYTEMTEFDGDLWKLGFEAEALKHLKTEDGKTLGDHLALLIGSVGENAAIKRAMCFKTSADLQLSGYAHPTTADAGSTENVTQFGKYGAILAVRGSASSADLKNLCQHIVGLKPKKIGEEGKDEPAANKDDETCLIYQEYLLDDSKTVGELLEEQNLTVLDYQRFECGENSVNLDLHQAKLSN